MGQVRLPYYIRVLIPCYSEDLECIKATVEVNAAALLPFGCQRTIYLCDDGKDAAKRDYILSKGPGFQYVSGRCGALPPFSCKPQQCTSSECAASQSCSALKLWTAKRLS